MRVRLIHASSSRMAEVAMRARELMERPGARVLKHEGRTRAVIVTLSDGDALFIKRVESRSWLAGIAHRIAGNRAAGARAGAAMLAAAGVAHPPLLGAIELRRAGAVIATILVSRALLDAQTFSRFVGREGRVERRTIFDAVAREIRRLHDAGLFTLDMQETNLMLERGEAGGVNVHFVDLEDFRRARRVSERRRLLNLVHLDRSIGRFATRGERLRFLCAYLGGRPARAEMRRIVAALMRLRERAARSAGRRKGRARSAASQAGLAAVGAARHGAGG